MARTQESLTGIAAMVKVLEQEESHELPVPELIARARTMSLAEAQAAVEKATERLAQAKANLKAVEKSAAKA